MRKNILLSILMLAAFSLFAQRKSTTYYDANWNKISKKKHAFYYRETYLKSDTLYATDYFITGTIQMTGTYLDEKAEIKHGPFFYYNRSGIKTSEDFYDNGKRTGKSSRWTENGILSETLEFTDDLRNGESLRFYNNGQTLSKMVYRNDTLVSKAYWNEDGSTYEADSSFVEEMPEFSGGQKAFIKFLQSNLSYPKRAQRKGIEGRVVLQFIVNTDGSVTDVSIVKSVDPEIDAEALRIVSIMPRWSPGRQNGKPVTVRYTLPLTFKLN